MRRLFTALGVVALALAASATAVGAIETSEFGVGHMGDKTLEVRAGKTTHSRIELWNKTDHPVTVRIWPVAAHLDEAGTAVLGGDATAVSWIKVSEAKVTLPAKGSKEVDVAVHAPRKISMEDRTVALMTQSVATGGAAEGVVQRIAVLSYLHPVGPSSAGLGILPWIAGAGLAAAVLGLVHRARRGRLGPMAPTPQVAVA